MRAIRSVFVSPLLPLQAKVTERRLNQTVVILFVGPVSYLEEFPR